MRLSSHGFLGFAAMTAGTVREALELATRFCATRTSLIGLALHVEGATASLAIEERTDLGRMREPLVLALIVGIWQMGQVLTGRTLDGAGECAFPEPAYARAVRDAKRLRFDRPAHRLVFAAALLDLPVTSADVAATRLAIDQCERELAAADTSFPAQLRRAIADGKSLPQAAKGARMSTRTLKRRLAAHGTTFSALRDESRRQRALLLLADRRLSIGEIATRLGYTELPNFTRAFRKWTGMTPLAYRERDG
jgi:AraC-like DNA-binding protein